MTRRNALSFYRASALVIFLAILFVPGFREIIGTGDNFYEVYLNGTYAGALDSPESAAECLVSARRNLAAETEGYVFAESRLETTGDERFFGLYSSKADVERKMEEILRENTESTAGDSYTVKIRNYIVNLKSLEDVSALLNRAVDQYDEDNRFSVALIKDESRQLGALNAVVEDTAGDDVDMRFGNVGIFSELDRIFEEAVAKAPKDFNDYDYGVTSMHFGNRVDVVASYIPEEQVSDVDTAFHEITKDTEKKSIYEVKSGDTLSGISEALSIPMDEIVAMNDSLIDENTTLGVGDEITVTIPEPELSICYDRQEYKEEAYDAEIQYVDNDDWYTNEEKTLAEPSAGFHKVVAVISYDGVSETGREIQKEEVVVEAVAKVVERGTKIPPTYIKPLYGGRISSGFGRRNRPTRGASTFHKGIDYATPVGTAIMASSGGVVTKAGWGSGYGKVVYIHHANGMDTRYGHLSRVLVSVGQTVKQGQKIALSGNTGVSTGPHLHFEILVNGTQVNPAKYLQ